MQTQPTKKSRASGFLSGDSAVHFVVGELSRLGHIALPTVRNTKGVDIVVSKADFSETTYLQVKSNRNKYDFWIVGNPTQGDTVFYVFVNLLSNKGYVRPEYYVVPSADVRSKFSRFEAATKHDNPTPNEVENVIRLIKERETAWSIVDIVGISVRAIRKIADDNALKINYDRHARAALPDKSSGEDFPFSFYIRENAESKYKDKWDLLFSSQQSKSTLE